MLVVLSKIKIVWRGWSSKKEKTGWARPRVKASAISNCKSSITERGILRGRTPCFFCCKSRQRRKLEMGSCSRRLRNKCRIRITGQVSSPKRARGNKKFIGRPLAGAGRELRLAPEATRLRRGHTLRRAGRRPIAARRTMYAPAGDTGSMLTHSNEKAGFRRFHYLANHSRRQGWAGLLPPSAG